MVEDDRIIDILGDLPPILPSNLEEELQEWEEEWQRYIELGRPPKKEGHDVYDKRSAA